MRKAIDDGGSAFPQSDLSEYGIGPRQNGDVFDVRGMSLRDWFAGMALNGFPLGDITSDQASESAYEQADAMLAERAKVRKP